MTSVSEAKTPTRFPIWTTVFIVFVLVLLVVLVWRPSFEASLAPAQIHAETGLAYAVDLRFRLPAGYQLVGDGMDDGFRSSLVLLQDGSPIGGAHSAHADIRGVGNGAYSHWHDVLYFSTPGNTDPRTDGHLYTIRTNLDLSTTANVLVFAGLLLLAATLSISIVKELGAQRDRLQGWWKGLAGMFEGYPGRCALAAIAFLLILQEYSKDWDQYVVTPDSGGFTVSQLGDPGAAVRPPAMTYWIELFSDVRLVGDRIQAAAKGGEINRAIPAGPSDPIIGVVQAQRLFLAIAFALICYVLTTRIPALFALALIWMAVAPFPEATATTLTTFATLVVLVIAGLDTRGVYRIRRGASGRARVRDAAGVLIRGATVAAAIWCFGGQVLQYSYLSEQQLALMSEPLAMCWQLLFGACVIHFVWRRHGAALVAAALFAAAGYLTRSASVFLVVMLFGLLLLALYWDGRRALVSVVLAGTVALLVASSVPIISMIKGDGQASSAPMLNWGPIAFAVEVARPGDERHLHDEDAQRFLSIAIALRDEAVKKVPAPEYRSANLGIDLYLAALPAVQNVLPNSGWKERGELMSRVWQPLLRAHALDYAAIVWDSVLMATGLRSMHSTTRLFDSSVDWLALAALVSLTLFGPFRDPRIAIASLFLLGMHLAHIAVVCAFDVPLTRYVHATEIFVVIALGMLLSHHARGLLAALAGTWVQFAMYVREPNPEPTS